MMDCKQFRETLDCYVDRELSPDAAAAADAHWHECAACERAMKRLLRLRGEIRRTVSAVSPPPLLERRVRRAIKPAWMGLNWPSTPARMRLSLAAVLVLAAAVWIAAANRTWIEHAAVATMDRGVMRLAGSGSSTLEGVVLCRDCELQRRYGVKAMCQRIGHHGAIATADGRIWNIVEQRLSADLIHDNALLGKKVRIRARVLWPAGSLAIETFEIEG